MAKEIIKKIKLDIEAGKANPAPPVGTVLGPAGINLQEFCTKYNEATRDKMGDIAPVEITIYDDRSFDAGEHIISIEIDDPTIEKKQYEYHEGYKVVGISTDAHGEYSYNYGQAHLVYSNEYPVKCHPTHIKGEELLYTDFGEPTNYEREKTTSGTGWREFNPGEHIISVPLEEQETNNYQINYHDGYEVVGIASSSYGKYQSVYGGGCILYVNTEKVKCIEDESDENSYTTFGIPEEDTKVLEK